MKKISMVMASVLLSTYAYADNSKIELRGVVDDGNETVMSSGLITKYFTSGVRQQQTVSCTAGAFTSITVPSGAKAILIDVGTSTDLALKGVTGDTGISLDSTCPVLLPISDDPATTTLGLLNRSGSAKTAKVYFF